VGNPIKLLLVAAGVGACIFWSVGMLWAELGMPALESFDWPHTIKLLQAEPLMKGLVDTYNGMFKAGTEAHLTSKNAEGPVGDYVYALAIAMAFVGGAVAIMAVGSEDETEKTVVPVKK
jgi:hypothetical protein